MTEVADLLAEIRRSGGDVRLVGCDKVKLIAPTALLPKLAERVRAAKPMVLAALANTDREAARESGEGVLNPLPNSATVQHPAGEASPDWVIPTPAARWNALHREALAYWGAFHPADEAARLAWGKLENDWHRQHGCRAPEWQCAGCGEPIGGHAAMRLADGNRVHLGDGLDCLFAFGKRWRGEATAGLRALGLHRPADFGEPL
jgi:hypothetical protein